MKHIVVRQDIIARKIKTAVHKSDLLCQYYYFKKSKALFRVKYLKYLMVRKDWAMKVRNMLAAF